MQIKESPSQQNLMGQPKRLIDVPVEMTTSREASSPFVPARYRIALFVLSFVAVVEAAGLAAMYFDGPRAAGAGKAASSAPTFSSGSLFNRAPPTNRQPLPGLSGPHIARFKATGSDGGVVGVSELRSSSGALEYVVTSELDQSMPFGKLLDHTGAPTSHGLRLLIKNVQTGGEAVVMPLGVSVQAFAGGVGPRLASPSFFYFAHKDGDAP